MTIDVSAAGGQLKIDSDLCFDDGEIVAAGPVAQVTLGTDEELLEAAVHDWLLAFEQFLVDVEATTVRAASRLS